MSMVVGFVGAFIGHWLRGVLHLPNWFAIHAGGVSFSLVWSVLGAALLVMVLRLVMTRGRTA